MLQIDDKLISEDIINKKFFCDLSACKGICCIEGESGAPLEENEKASLQEILPFVWNDLSGKAKEVINKKGVCYVDSDGDLVTSIVDGKNCVFTYMDKNGCCFCSIEKAYREGKIKFYKPVSCHLYPIRVTDYGKFTAVNYHRWEICRQAVLLGEKKGIPLYRFLGEALIRKFGKDWYDKLCIAAGYFTE